MRTCLFVLWSACAFAADPPLDFRLSTSLDSPQVLSTVVSITGLTAGGSGSTVWYRFRTRAEGGKYEMLRDFGPRDTLDWTVWDREGIYEMEVTAQDKGNGQTATITLRFEWLPVAKDRAVVTPTQHPLVFLYSAPTCEPGAISRVQFTAAGGWKQQTPQQPCDGLHTMNFLIAGLLQETDYELQGFVSDKALEPLQVRTPRLPDEFQIPIAVTGAEIPQSSNGILLYAAQQPNYEIATDLNGNLVWYYPDAVSFITRPITGGRLLALIASPAGTAAQRMIEFDLLGITRKETCAARVNEQLTAMGKKAIAALHHEARLLSNGHYALLATRMQSLTDVQGSGAVNVIGDVILVLDQDLNVVWTWDAFENLDPHRSAVLNETCRTGGCPPTYKAPLAHDWTHGNSLQLTPDGALLYSSRHQDWVIKINYENGKGDGHILWRLGKDGDFRMDSTDPAPWFSHQHDAHFLAGDVLRIALFDNGNTRLVTNAEGHSRGQVIEIDETNRTARLVLNADLGVVSNALGSAQALQDGRYHFNAGTVPNESSLHLEVDGEGKVIRSLKLPETAYRSFRMADLYSGVE